MRDILEKIDSSNKKVMIILKNNQAGKSVSVSANEVIPGVQVKKIKKALGVDNDNKQDIGVRGPQEYLYLDFYSRGAVMAVTPEYDAYRRSKEKDDMMAW